VLGVSYIYDYESGYIINPSTGEVVDRIIDDTLTGNLNINEYTKPLPPAPARHWRLKSTVYRKAIDFLSEYVDVIDTNLLSNIIETLIQLKITKVTRPLALAATYIYLKENNITIDVIKKCIESAVHNHGCRVAWKLIMYYYAYKIKHNKTSRRVEISKYIMKFPERSVTEVAIKLLSLIPDYKLSGKTTSRTAAILVRMAILLLGLEDKYTAKYIANIFNVSDATICSTLFIKYLPIKVSIRPSNIIESIETTREICSLLPRISPKVKCS